LFKKHKKILSIAVVMAIAPFVAACQDDAAKSEQSYPASKVAVVTMKAEALPITNELPGRIAPTRIAEVRPRVSGIVVERVFEQGSVVKRGDVLYRIDPAPFEVEVDSAEAALARAESLQIQAQQKSERQEQLRRSNITSAQTLDDAIAVLAQSKADVAAAKAGLKQAKLNLQYASVTAPISGRIGRALITEGALVSAANTEKLATIQQLDPIYADFTQPAAELIGLRKALQEGQLMTGPNEASVQLVLDDGTPYESSGKLLFSEAAVDAGTGQITLRGEFPNSKGDLLPGMYVRVRIEQGIERSALAVPQQAVQRDAGGQASVLVVNADNIVEQRFVTVGRIVEKRFVIDQGVKEGDQVIAEGFQKAPVGATVIPEPWQASTVKTDKTK